MATDSARSILLGLGMGDYNATMVIPYMFMAPAQTDPQMAQIILLTSHMQRVMQSMGAPATVTGSWDHTWIPYLESLASSNWSNVVWFELARGVLQAKKSGATFTKDASEPSGYALSGLGEYVNGVPNFALALGLGAAAYLLLRKR